MIALQKNYLSQNKSIGSLIKKQRHFLLSLLLFISINFKAQQIANYINNGGFEEVVPDMLFPYPKYWSSLDTTKPWAQLLTRVIPPHGIPYSNYCYQWPRNGDNFLITGLYNATANPQLRGYPRNRLKQPLEAGKVYCVSFYVNLTNQSTHGIDAIGAYFSDSGVDSIHACNEALTYLVPQIQNPANNIITDTLHWTLINGQFTANGTEKYLIIGNFRSDANTNISLVNPANLPANAADYNVDDVSVIARDLPAYAGVDKSFLPGDSVFIGRQSDVGIDEVCLWYKLPTVITPTTPAIDTIAGMWVKPMVTTTYVVKQQLPCSTVKWDTVVVYQTAVGLGEISLNSLEFNLYPNPANENLNITGTIDNGAYEVTIYDTFGQVLREEEITFKIK